MTVRELCMAFGMADPGRGGRLDMEVCIDKSGIPHHIVRVEEDSLYPERTIESGIEFDFRNHKIYLVVHQDEVMMPRARS